MKKHKVNKQDLMDLFITETILDEGMAAMGGPQQVDQEQKLRPNPSRQNIKKLCENLNPKSILIKK